MKVFGLLANAELEQLKEPLCHADILYSAAFDRTALWDPTTIDKVLESFPKGLIDESDLFLILAECIANSVLHGQAELLGFHARLRSGLLLLSFHQIPKMHERVGLVLSLARNGLVKECAAELPGGLGFPILLRLARRITISNDFSKLQLWMQRKNV